MYLKLQQQVFHNEPLLFFFYSFTESSL